MVLNSPEYCGTLALLPWKATKRDRLLMPLPLVFTLGFPPGAVVNGFFTPVFLRSRQGALALACIG
jgi:hypothetical protein